MFGAKCRCEESSKECLGFYFAILETHKELLLTKNEEQVQQQLARFTTAVRSDILQRWKERITKRTSLLIPQ